MLDTLNTTNLFPTHTQKVYEGGEFPFITLY